MTVKYDKANKLLLTTGMLSGWFALIAQLYLMLLNNPIPALEALTRYISYFTILSNIMVALCCTMLLFNFYEKAERFYAQPKTLAAVTLYICVVGLIYNLILRFTWQPQGLQRLVDELLHSFIPALFLIYWLIFAPKHTLKWADAFPWLIYPLIYLIFILIRGAYTGFYPYPFVDVTAFGYPTVFQNSFYILIVFLGLSFLLIWVGKSIAKRQK
ncbi:hypothetical protein AQ505_19885 [Pedobacter sp. PACM 27299]|uniref:Pr6Pr family membrane protein n=1 Tax=Pedobacter sp. PACM 27299 TaxID=1727164 RepID=UPI0007066309|nr:Pr6Pr family membrane protein [Pedobacter sp. PACM 27299]ALL07552.1 hypothetical protein AQ505_19885 [Pedobacter sp. PACM 27299]